MNVGLKTLVASATPILFAPMRHRTPFEMPRGEMFLAVVENYLPLFYIPAVLHAL
jgi:hypothetical protein